MNIVNIPIEIFALLLVLGVIIFVWDLLLRRSGKLKTSGGLAESSQLVSLRDAGELPSREFYSEKLGLRSRPDALVKEDGMLLPISIRPIGKKVQDRHVIELLVHLRLIEEETGKRPPHGLLLLGQESRRVIIKNTVEKQAWLDRVLLEMRAIVNGAEPVPTPSYYKCKSCDVQKICPASAYHPDQS